MTIDKAITSVNKTVPNTLERKTLIDWLSRVDWQIKVEILDNYVDEVEYNGYDADTKSDQELLVPAPYDEIYIRYLEAQIYRYLGENTKYNDCISEFNAIYRRFQAQYTRDHMPKGEHRYKYYGG